MIVERIWSDSVIFRDMILLSLQNPTIQEGQRLSAVASDLGRQDCGRDFPAGQAAQQLRQRRGKNDSWHRHADPDPLQRVGGHRDPDGRRFFDEKNFKLCDELGIHFIGTGKAFEAIKEKVAAIGEKEWRIYDNGRQKWSFTGFEYRCDKWENPYRALYTRPKYEDQQGLLEFARPDNIIVTNLASGPEGFGDEELIFHHHQRGADELPHRGLKEFGSEQLPFKRNGANQAYYYMMVIAFCLFQTFKEDNLQGILPIATYANTVRRQLVDIAAKVVRTGHDIILKVTKAVMEASSLFTFSASITFMRAAAGFLIVADHKLDVLWKRCRQAQPVLIS